MEYQIIISSNLPDTDATDEVGQAGGEPRAEHSKAREVVL